MTTCMGYITTKNAAEAQAIAHALVEKKLVACANIFPEVESIYTWEGKVETATEAVLIVKTTKKLQDKVQAFVKALHSYSVPCIVFYEMQDGNPDYLKWIRDSTS